MGCSRFRNPSNPQTKLTTHILFWMSTMKGSNRFPQTWQSIGVFLRQTSQQEFCSLHIKCMLVGEVIKRVRTTELQNRTVWFSQYLREKEQWHYKNLTFDGFHYKPVVTLTLISGSENGQWVGCWFMPLIRNQKESQALWMRTISLQDF